MVKNIVEDFRQQFELPVTVYYEDTDALGIVYHANYLKYLERARTEHLASMGFSLATLAVNDIQFVVRHIGVDFFKGAKLLDRLKVASSIAVVKRASLHYHQKIVYLADDSVIFCQAVVKLACVSRQLKPVALPAIFSKEQNLER